ncbi:MAG: zinc-binding alcohol dehydrogenase family protein [Negativicutes bacterium]|nr:zinc-binding alcohol dehydrogenase family protein [Negativicutes bacterium]
MKAAVITGPRQMELVERPIPALPDEKSVLMKVRAVGICGSDVHGYHGSLATFVYPRVFGHEVVGEIIAVGSAVSHLTAGDHAVMDPVQSCGNCRACRTKRQNVCAQLRCMGVGAEGGCAEYVALPAANVLKIPAGIPWREAVLIEPYTIAAQMTARGEVAKDDDVLIMGAGPIGLVTLQAAKRKGARVMITDISANRLALAGKLDADAVVNSKEQNLAEEVRRFTNGEGMSVAIDAVGLPELFEQAVELTGTAARIVIIGFNPEAAKIPELPITKRELDIRGSRLHANKFPEVIDWFAKGEVKTLPLISHEFDFLDVKKAFSLIEQDPDHTCKVILTFKE